LVVNGVMEQWVDTDVFGRVVAASAGGATFFNLSVRGLIGRDLRLFFLERQLIIEGLRAARGGRPSGNIVAAYRPMEKRARRARIELLPLNDGVRWHLGDVANPAVVRDESGSPCGVDCSEVSTTAFTPWERRRVQHQPDPHIVGPRGIDIDRV
jgi:hypothetical protein